MDEINLRIVQHVQILDLETFVYKTLEGTKVCVHRFKGYLECVQNDLIADTNSTEALVELKTVLCTCVFYLGACRAMLRRHPLYGSEDRLKLLEQKVTALIASCLGARPQTCRGEVTRTEDSYPYARVSHVFFLRFGRGGERG